MANFTTKKNQRTNGNDVQGMVFEIFGHGILLFWWLQVYGTFAMVWP
jgi:hypothetical protein